MRSRTALIINSHSRQAGKHTKRVVHAVKKLSNINLVETIVIEELDALDECLDKLASVKDLECVIVGSGDGTIIAALNTLKDRKITYGFLPLGTSNTFVRSLGLPQNYKKVLKIIEGDYTRPVSLGMINGVIFANIAGVGLPARVSARISNRTKRYLGPFAYMVSGFWTFLRHKAFFCVITTDERTETFYTHHLLIANGAYHGHLSVSHNASAFNDKLMVVSFGTTKSRWHYFFTMLRFSVKRHESDPNTRIFPITKATLVTEPRRMIEVDAELIGKTPATIEVKKHAIQVFTPLKKQSVRGRRKTRH